MVVVNGTQGSWAFVAVVILMALLGVYCSVSPSWAVRPLLCFSPVFLNSLYISGGLYWSSWGASLSCGWSETI